MSVFDLDTGGQTALDEEAAANPLSVTETKPGVFDNLGSGIGNGIMRGGARVGQFIGMAGAVIPMAIDKVAGTDYTDDYFKTLDDTVNNAVDYWTPNAAETGKAGQILGGLSEIALPLMAGGGNPTLLIGSQEMGTATDLVRQGVTPGKATAAGIVQGLSTAVGLKLPFLGKSLLTRMASGAAGNLATNAGAAAIQHEITGLDQFNPLDLEARAVDILTGIAFGGLAHVQMKPGDIAAVAAANDAKHFQLDSAPGRPMDEASSVAHQQAMEQAINDTIAGEKVTAPVYVQDAAFAPRELASVPESVIKDYADVDKAVKAEQGASLAKQQQAIDEAAAATTAVEPGLKPGENSTATETDPIITSAQQAVLKNDFHLPTGELDAEGNAKTSPASELLAQADEQVKLAQTDSKAFDAAVNCFLSQGGA